MKFEERLSEIMNEVEVPDELLPQNIAVMLREKSKQPHSETEKKNIRPVSDISAQRRTIIMRSAAAVAACAVFTVGMLAYGGRGEQQEQLEELVEYEAVTVSPDSYDALYKIYTGITLGGGDRSAEREKTIDEDIADIDSLSGNSDGCPADSSAYDFSDYKTGKISEADIVKSDGNYLYCLKGSDLSIVSLETMEVVSEIDGSLNPPFEIYINDGKLIMISGEKENIISADISAEASQTENYAAASDVPAKDADTYQSADNNPDVPDEAVSDDKTGPAYGSGKSAIPESRKDAVSRTNAAVDIYDVSDPSDPIHTTSYKQNGIYVSSKIAGGVLYMATAYSDYRVKPLDTQEDLDGFVPAYYLNGEKHYLAAEDIIVPGGAASTDYTVISAIDVSAGDASVKAVLGSSKNVYCSADTLYVVSVGRKDREYSVISSFSLSEGGIVYRASGSVEGIVLGQQSMNEYGGFFRLAAETTDENGKRTVSIYVLDKSLTVVNSAGQLFPEGRASAVRFERQFARIIDEKSGESAIVLDLSENPPVQTQIGMGNEAYLYGYSDDVLLGLGKTQNGGLALTAYDSETGLTLYGTVIGGGEEGEYFSEALSDRRAVLIDKSNDLIGIPVYSHNEFGTKNSYRVFSCGESGFVQKGVIEYMDVDDSMIFKRGFTDGEALYVISSGRVISARLSDLKVIGTYEY